MRAERADQGAFGGRCALLSRCEHVQRCHEAVPGLCVGCLSVRDRHRKDDLGARPVDQADGRHDQALSPGPYTGVMAGAAVPAYWLVDLDGVLVREGTVIDGADRFLDALRASGRRLLVLTNNSIYTPRDLSARLATMGLEVPESELWTAALATARFVQTQRPNG